MTLFSFSRHFLLLLLLTTSLGFAQQTRRPDQIVRLDNSIIEAVISEIEDGSILYRKFSAPTGPAIRIDKKSISYIRYSNGDIERFTDVPAAAAPATAKTSGKPAARKATARGSEPAATAAMARTQSEPVAEEPLAEPAPVAARTTRTRPADEPRSAAAPRRSTPQRASSARSMPAAYSGGKPPVSVFITAGGGLSQQRISAAGQSESSGYLISFRGGLGVSIPLSEKISLTPTAEYAQLGATDPDDAKIAQKLNYGQFSLPIQFTSAGSGARFILAAGPFAAYALSGTTTDGTNSAPIEFNDSFNKLHIGAIGQVGIRFGQLSVLGYYATSLTNLANVPTGTSANVALHSFGGMLRLQFGK